MKKLSVKRFFALIHAFVASRKAEDDQARRRKGENCHKLRAGELADRCNR